MDCFAHSVNHAWLMLVEQTSEMYVVNTAYSLSNAYKVEMKEYFILYV